jgi:hypothetical protein
MPIQLAQKPQDIEIQIQKALYALQIKDFISIRAAARFFKICYRTLQRRRNGGLTRSTSQEMRQVLTNAEESTLTMDKAIYKYWDPYNQ